MTSTSTTADSGVSSAGAADLARAVAQRRNFAIISHPDAGKTTLTEKLLLYGGAIQQAGAVKAKGEQRKVTSDWMELEKQRGISITSTVLQFGYAGSTINPVSYTHLRAHETREDLVCRLLLEKKK